jgi:hypothetical protein
MTIASPSAASFFTFAFGVIESSAQVQFSQGSEGEIDESTMLARHG